MNTENRLNYAWQKVRLTIPNMMALYNMYKPATLDKWEQVVYNNIDINPILDTLEEIAEVSTDDSKEWINKHLIEDTFNGGQMQDQAIQIIENEGYEASIATEEEDKKGIDITAKNGDKKVNIQIKPISFCRCKSPICTKKQDRLKQQAKDNDILIMTYDNGHFLKSLKNKYLHKINELLETAWLI